MLIKKHKIKALVESDIYEKLEDKNYELISVNPNTLLSWNRLTICFNAFYLENKDKHPNFAKLVYKERVKATSLGSYSESKEKNTFDAFLECFDNIDEDIKKHGFDKNKTIISLAKDGSILNGSHRVASCIVNQEPVYCIRTNIEAPTDNSEWLYKRGMDPFYLQIGIRYFIQNTENTYLAFLFPSCDHKKTIQENFNRVAFQSEITLTNHGTHNLLTELYKHMIEINGKPKEGFHTIKQRECFPDLNNKNKVNVIVFTEDSLDSVIKIKSNIRKNCGIGHSSVHITDTKEEALRISELIFNDNGLHFLNYANPYRFHKTNSKNLAKIKEFMDKNKIEKEDFLIDSSMIMSLYGLRRNDDVDFLTVKKLIYKQKDFDEHDSELVYQKQTKEELIYNPNFYFIFCGIKFLSFQQLFKMKTLRNEQKDVKDCDLMNALISQDRYKKLLANTRQNIFYFRVKYKKVINALIILFVYYQICNLI